MWHHETNVARNDISELGFNQTLISRVPANYLWLDDGMSFYLFLCYTQGNFLVNRNKWRIVFIDDYNCLPDSWVTQVRRILAFPCNHFLSVCMFMYKCHLMLISVNIVDSTFSARWRRSSHGWFCLANGEFIFH